MNPAALSEPVRIVSRGIPRSSCAREPVVMATIAAAAEAMIGKITLPMAVHNSYNRGNPPPARSYALAVTGVSLRAAIVQTAALTYLPALQ
jgi:hypothetical protein